MLIRPAEPKDVEGVAVICRRVLAEKLPYNYELNIGTEGCWNLVAEDEGRVVGYLTMLVKRWDPRGRHLWQRLVPYIAFVGVRPEWQRQGIGAALVRDAIREAARLCPLEPRLFLEHAPHNVASRLYQRVGFRALSADEVRRLAGLNVSSPVMCFPLDTIRAAAS
jgi:GNAT superfamily N-acetyltransferase